MPLRYSFTQWEPVQSLATSAQNVLAEQAVSDALLYVENLQPSAGIVATAHPADFTEPQWSVLENQYNNRSLQRENLVTTGAGYTGFQTTWSVSFVNDSDSLERNSLRTEWVITPRQDESFIRCWMRSAAELALSEDFINRMDNLPNLSRSGSMRTLCEFTFRLLVFVLLTIPFALLKTLFQRFVWDESSLLAHFWEYISSPTRLGGFLGPTET